MSSFCGLKAIDFADKKANFHTHTTRCHHAVGEEREYVEKAIEAGFQVLGFSDHGPMLRQDGFVSSVRMLPEELEGYVNTILTLRREYQKDISLYVGLEIENMPCCFDRTIDFYRQFPIDYLILGQHFLGNEGEAPYVSEAQTEPAFLEKYVSAIEEALDTDLFMYVAHPDVFRFTGDQRVYFAGMQRILNKLKEKNMPVEINGNGFRDNRYYPDERFVRMAAENNNYFIVGVDAHDPLILADQDTMEGCINLAKKAGGRLICL